MASSQVRRAALVGLDGSRAVTAVGGGLALATGLGGGRFPARLLRGPPVRSDAVPGLFLAGEDAPVPLPTPPAPPALPARQRPVAPAPADSAESRV
jgi:hypothetical protein